MSGDKGMRAFQALCEIRGLEAMDERTFREKCVHVDPYDPELWDPLYVALEAGDWYAMAYRKVPGQPAASTRERIGEDLWSFLEIDPDDDLAAGAGVEFVGVRYSKAKPKPSHEQLPQVSEADLTIWLKEQWATGRIDRDEYEQAARAHFVGKAVDRKTYRKLYQATRPVGLSKLGRPPSAD